MSGDVQPRKRKDKKRKKDELGVEEPRGTAAALGDGDLFIHSPHDHGTGGHWCAKIIFFSLLAILITLIGLIILENRGLSELEANSVESRYSGVLEGWLEDIPDDDHHDEHTLELKHHEHEENEDEHDIEEHQQDDENGEDLENDEDGEGLEHDDEDNSEQEDEEENEDEIEEQHYSNEEAIESNRDEENYDDDIETGENDNEDDDNDDDEDENQSDEQNIKDDGNNSEEEQHIFNTQQNYFDENENVIDDNKYENDEDLEDNENNDSGIDDFDDKEQNEEELVDNDQNENNDETNENEDDDEHDEEGDDDDDHGSEEVERIEKEVPEEEPISTELPALPEKDDDDDNDSLKDDDDKNEDSKENEAEDKEDDDAADDEDDEFLEQVDEEDDGPPIEKITAPSGQPFDEIDEVTSSEKPPNTLDEEEEYEKKQEELRREEEQKSSQMWLKLLVGGALLVATQAVVRRATTPRDYSEENEEGAPEEESPSVVDRRMTLLLNEPPVQEIPKKSPMEISKQISQDVPKKSLVIIKSAQTPKQISAEEEEEEDTPAAKEIDKELYSDEELEEEEEEEQIIVPTKIAPKQAAPASKQAVSTSKEQPKNVQKPPEIDIDDEEVGEDVEIIDEEQLEEEEEEVDEDEEEISDVDDAELLTRLEAKYGRLPEPERPGARHKDGGNSMEDYWPSEPSDPFWHQQLDEAERDLLQGRLESALSTAQAVELKTSARAQWVVAQALDKMAEQKRDNRILTQAIIAYMEVLKMNQNMSDKKLLQVTARALNRIQFRGTYIKAEPIYRLLIRRFPNEVNYRNNLTISFLMAGRADLAEGVLKETLALWPNDRVALAHYGFVIKTEHNRLEEAVELFQKALEGDTGPACEPRFYYQYGDALLLLGRFAEAHEVHKRATAHGHFLSAEQRSLYNVPRLKSRPWWNIEQQTPYAQLARALEKSWREILKEGEAAKALYEKEKEGLRERGEWSQLDLFVRGQEIPGRCKQAPVTCSIVRSEVAAVGCRRGQIKFSSMEPGTHVRPHVGPTNCRLRMHLGLKNTKDTYIRVNKETRQWHEGKVFLFDDSFEHEVWHNGTGTRLVLIVDVWHPDLTANERRQLPAI